MERLIINWGDDRNQEDSYVGRSDGIVIHMWSAGLCSFPIWFFTLDVVAVVDLLYMRRYRSN